MKVYVCSIKLYCYDMDETMRGPVEAVFKDKRKAYSWVTKRQKDIDEMEDSETAFYTECEVQ